MILVKLENGCVIFLDHFSGIQIKLEIFMYSHVTLNVIMSPQNEKLETFALYLPNYNLLSSNVYIDEDASHYLTMWVSVSS